MLNISKYEFRFRRFVLRLPKRTLLILICILIGVVAGISAFLLKSLLQYIHHFIQLLGNQNMSNILLVVLPIVGLFLTVTYISIFHAKGFKKGISQILTLSTINHPLLSVARHTDTFFQAHLQLDLVVRLDLKPRLLLLALR
jgi:H+/Cl- antiporter ClcA